MLNFPEEITVEILTRLPVKSLSRFRCVSKSWYNLIKTPNFVKLHLNHSLKYGNHGVLSNDEAGNLSYIDYESSSSTLSDTIVHFDFPIEHRMQHVLRLCNGSLVVIPSEHRTEGILGSCNGLVCYISYEKDMIIWNPYTGDYKILPAPPETESILRGRDSIDVFYKYGFGYDSNTEDYRVVRMLNIRGKYSEVAVYSLKLDLWKTYSDIPFVFASGDLVFFDGILHWLEVAPLFEGIVQGHPFEHTTQICSFDIDSEEFKEIPLPQHFSDKFNKIHIRLLGDGLCLIRSLYKTCSQVWMMKDYGVQESWTEMFTIGETEDLGGFDYLDLRQSFKNGVILVQPDFRRQYMYFSRPCMYDLKLKKFRKLEIDLQGFCTQPFLGSLVSPSNLGTG